jgi:hypothetical protein
MVMFAAIRPHFLAFISSHFMLVEDGVRQIGELAAEFGANPPITASEA